MNKLATFCIFMALLLGMSGFVLGIHSADIATQNSASLRVAVADIQTLLLNGKTASAVSAKKTARIVAGIQSELTFDHKSTVRGQKTLAAAERALEQHLDRTIRAAILQEAQQVLHGLAH
jgi:hypothetical protein